MATGLTVAARAGGAVLESWTEGALAVVRLAQLPRRRGKQFVQCLTQQQLWQRPIRLQRQQDILIEC